MLHLLCASLLFALAFGQHPASDVVQTEYGKVQGFSVSTRSGFKADVFLGVPFAQPPTGDLRFERPEPPFPWDGVRTTDRLQEACFGIGVFGPYNMSEDCLYLNIFAPQQKAESYPVMVIIHGGGFMTGSAHMYRDYNDLAESYVSKGIVVVTIQHRLFVHGYASLGSDSLKGNLGHWDQVAALKFLQSNIAAFGGDPKRVTIYGYSAGSVSASTLSVSPHSRDLFAKAIQMGGSVLAEWGGSDLTLTYTKQLLAMLGCKYSTDDEAKRCLKAASNDDITAATQKMNLSPRRTNFGVFGPRIDGDFFPKPAAELIKEAPKKPTYAGMCEEESIIFTVIQIPMSGLFLPQEKHATFSEKDFVEFLDVVVDTQVFGAQAKEVREKIAEFYLSKDAPDAKDSFFYLRRYVQLCSDIQFNVPILREAVLKTELDWPVFLYVNHYMPKNKIFDVPFEAVSHSYDHQFVFRGDNKYYPMNYTKEDEDVSDFLVESIVSFVKTGDPSTKTVAWPRTTKNHPLRHLRIGHRPEVRDLLFAERLHFWDSLAAEFGHDVVQGIPAQLQKVKQEL
ncbi:CBN-GES-1 protein [Aphelenchoides avenae]|nr:CBN-GES-1 protein [Aphelenchus avenae]